MKTITARLKQRSYTICVGKGILAKTGSAIKQSGLKGKAFVITNRKVGKLYLKPMLSSLKKAGYQTTSYVTLPDNESAKSQVQLGKVYAAMLTAGCDRSSFVVAIGGGIVGDLSGYAAATFMRGIPWVNVATTLLAQVDSAIGGKTGINLKEGKNLVGAFHQPGLVISDIDTLKSLPRVELKTALAEVIKYGVIWDHSFFEYLEKNMTKALKSDLNVLTKIVLRCTEIKARVVEKDERELSGLRAILNYGHTFAHGIEVASGSWRKSISHGIAVAIGMVAAGELGQRLGIFSQKDQLRQIELIKRAGLPTRIPEKLSVDKVLKGMQHDKKKKGNQLTFVVPQRIGKVVLRSDCSPAKTYSVLKSIQ